MICNAFRVPARASCRRTSPWRLSEAATGRLGVGESCPLTAVYSASRSIPSRLSSTFAIKGSRVDSRQGEDRGRRYPSAHPPNEEGSPQRSPQRSPPPPTAATPTKAENLSWADKWKATRSKVSGEYLRRFLRKYGRVAATFHISVFLATLGTCYSVVDYGGLDITALVKDIPILADNLPPASAGNLAVAYGMTSAIGPPRAVLTIMVTPKIAEFLDRRTAGRAGGAKEEKAEGKAEGKTP